MITIQTNLWLAFDDCVNRLTNYLHFLDNAGSKAEILITEPNWDCQRNNITRWVADNKLSHIIKFGGIPKNDIVINLGQAELLVSDHLDKWLILAEYLKSNPNYKGFNIPLVLAYFSIECTGFHGDFINKKSLALYNRKATGDLVGELVPECITDFKDYFNALRKTVFTIDSGLINHMEFDYEPFTHNLVKYQGNVLVTA